MFSKSGFSLVRLLKTYFRFTSDGVVARAGGGRGSQFCLSISIILAGRGEYSVACSPSPTFVPGVEQRRASRVLCFNYSNQGNVLQVADLKFPLTFPIELAASPSCLKKCFFLNFIDQMSYVRYEPIYLIVHFIRLVIAADRDGIRKPPFHVPWTESGDRLRFSRRVRFSCRRPPFRDLDLGSFHVVVLPSDPSAMFISNT